MAEKCPGQEKRTLLVEAYKCHKCGTEVEIFSDEVKAKCHNCGETVFKDKAATTSN